MKTTLSRRPLLAAFLIGAAAACVSQQPAFALDLDQARANGQIGERPDGMVGAVAASPSAEVAALVQSINAARMESYKDVAQKNGTPLDAVQKVAGEKLIQKAKENKWFVMTAAGTWAK